MFFVRQPCRTPVTVTGKALIVEIQIVTLKKEMGEI